MKRWLARAVRARPQALDPLQTSERPDPAFETTWRPALTRRITVVLAGLGLWGIAIEARLVKLQGIQHDELAARARQQQLDVIKPAAVRGDIVDRNGLLLAYSVDAAAIHADPALVKDPAEAARQLCGALRDCTPADARELAAKLARNGRWVELRKARTVSPNQAASVSALALGGVTLVTETRRYYPKLDLAAHLLGYVGTDNKGLGGIESKLDSMIRGREGRVLVQSDALKREMFTRVEQAPTAGATVELTVDLYLQHIAERELKAGVEAHRAKGGTVVILDPHSGEILALASLPTFNPNAFGRASEEDRRNRAVQDIYEPGSTFKIVTASAAIEEGVLTPEDLVDCGPGFIKFQGRKPITEASHHNYGVMSFEDVIVKSSNIGAIRAGLRVGPERLARYVRRFGFGDRLAPDFSGEPRGIVHSPADLNDSELASVSMGYHVGVTAIQMAAAASAVANGGLLMEPHVVRATVRDGVRQPTVPRVLRRAIAPQTAAALTTIMEGVVQRGTAKAARLERYLVAGKTGTAAKIINGQYSDTDYNASFVGFVPSRRPAFTVVVVVDTPRAGQTYGGSVAAPIFKRIADAALRHAGVPPTINPVAPLLVVSSDVPTPPAQPARATAVIPTLTRLGGRALMPDVRGMSGRQALRVLSAAGLSVRMSGDGFVTVQTPEPGEPTDPGGWSVLRLQRGVIGTPVAEVR